MPGPPPNPVHSRPRDTRRRIEEKATVIDDTPTTAAKPRLPNKEGGWATQTKRWWETWKESPQAKTFTSTDWMFLIETAYLADAFFTGDLKHAGELRQRMAKFGATPEDRARLRLQIKPHEDAAPETGPPDEDTGHVVDFELYRELSG
ncbi:hypothetical protein [Acrocarpospora sp. B8E8]|uniref:phage terminase small subunit n=1 Tax=Acrocarpospora sp. B8E8 TaxID=3153572 RepID=UPI00325F319A